MTPTEIGRRLADTADMAFWLVGFLTVFAVAGHLLPWVLRQIGSWWLRWETRDIRQPPKAWE